MRYGKWLARIGASALVLGSTAVIVATGSPAAADTTLVSCTGTQTTNYDPGLLFTEQSVRKSGENVWPFCAGAGPEITSAWSGFDVTITLSCSSPLGAASSSQIIKWSDGTESTFEWVSTRSVVAGQSITVLDGSFTAGTFAGSHARQTITAPQLNLLSCLAPPGVVGDFGVSQLVVTDV